MVTTQKFYAKNITQTSENTVWNSTNPQNPRKYRQFVNLDALKADDSNYATCNNLAGKNGTHNRPSTVTFTNFNISLPTDIIIKKIIVGYAHNKVSYSSKTAYPNVGAPTITLLNVSASGKGNAVPMKYSKYTKSFSISPNRSKIISSNFGVKINYPVNSNTNNGAIKLGYCWVQVVYEKVQKQVSGAVKKTTTSTNTQIVEDIVGINSTATSVFVGDTCLIDVDVTTSAANTPLKFQIDLGNDFTFVEKTEGDGTITTSNGLYWEVLTANTTAHIQFSVTGASVGTHYIIITDVTNPNDTKIVKKIGIVTLAEQIVCYPSLPTNGTENHTISYALEVFSTNPLTANKELTVALPSEIIIVDAITDYGDATFENTVNGNTVTWDVAFLEQHAEIEIIVELTSSGVYSQVLTDTTGNEDHLLNTSTIHVKPETLTVPFYSITEVADEMYNRFGQGVNYNVSCYMKVEITDDPETVADEQELFETYAYNYRLGVVQGDFQDEIEMFEMAEWSDPVSSLGEWQLCSVNFNFEEDEPLHIIRTGEYIENQATYMDVYFTEACIIEQSVNDGFELPGNYPIPIKGINTPVGYNDDLEEVQEDAIVSPSIFNMEKLENTTGVRLYDLDTDELVLLNAVVEGVSVHLDVQTDKSTNLLCKLIMPNGKVGSRSINLEDETNGPISIGGKFDLWGLDFEDFNIESLEDVEIEVIAQNPYLYDSVLEITNALLEYHYLELDDSFIEFWISKEQTIDEDTGKTVEKWISSRYYNMSLRNAEGVLGANNDVSYYQVTGSDKTIPYLSNIVSKNLDLEFSIGNCSIEEATIFLQRVSKLFSNNKDDFNNPYLNKIKFSHIPDIFYEYIMEDHIKEKIETGIYKCTVSLNIPAGTAYSIEESVTVSQGANNGIAKVSPTIQLLALDDTVDLTERKSGQNLNLIATGTNDIASNDYIIIDCENMKVTKNTLEDDGTFTTVDITDHVDFDSKWFSIIGEYDFDAGETALVQNVRFRERW